MDRILFIFCIGFLILDAVPWKKYLDEVQERLKENKFKEWR